jgi:ribonuclease P protein subunit POP4
MKKSDFMRSEFIGLEVEVSGFSGKVVDESKNTFTVLSEGKEKTVPKKGNDFRFARNGEKIDVKGSDILHRPEDRIKKVR